MNTEKTNRLLNRVAIVTGAGSREGISPMPDTVGNGRAASILLARAGALVVLADSNLFWAQRTQEIIETAPAHLSHGIHRTLVIDADVTRPSECEAVISAAVEKWGRVDILVNNVGIGGPMGTVVEVDKEQWKEVMEVNVLSMALMSKYAIPEMLRTRPDDMSHGTGKVIINVSSISGLLGGHLVYSTSKGAVISLTRAMAEQHGPAGIRVNTVAPGTVFTPMVAADGMPASFREIRKNMAPLKIEGYGWDVGNAVVFLASDEARWITGILLPVDAGATAAQSSLYGGLSAPGESRNVQSDRSKL